jgi:hypothetical protein
MNLGKFLHLRLQGASMDTPVFNDPATAVMGGSMAIGALSSKKGGTTQATQDNSPWWAVQPHLRDVYDYGANYYARGPYDYVGNQSPLTQQAQSLMAQRAQDPNSITGKTMGVLGDTISGKYLDPNSNPYLKASVQDALGMAGSTFAGQYGGAAGQNLGNSGYQEALARGLGATATNAYANAYGAERQNQLNAMQMAPSLGNLDASQLGAVGAQQEALQQQQFQSPWENLARYQSTLAQAPGGSSTTQSPYFTNPLATAMGMGLGGLSLYNGMNQAGLFGGPSGGTGMSMLGSFPTFA